MTPVPQAGGPGGPGGPGGAGSGCMAEFSKLQSETEKRGNAAKDGGKRKVAREEMCKLLQGFATAIGKWAKYTEANASACGIPGKIVEQLKAGATNIAKSREQVCSGGPMAGGPGKPPTPTLSDALGTTVMPTTESTRPTVSTGTLDTLTGAPIGR